MAAYQRIITHVCINCSTVELDSPPVFHLSVDLPFGELRLTCLTELIRADLLKLGYGFSVSIFDPTYSTYTHNPDIYSYTLHCSLCFVSSQWHDSNCMTRAIVESGEININRASGYLGPYCGSFSIKIR